MEYQGVATKKVEPDCSVLHVATPLLKDLEKPPLYPPGRVFSHCRGGGGGEGGLPGGACEPDTARGKSPEHPESISFPASLVPLS